MNNAGDNTTTGPDSAPQALVDIAKKHAESMVAELSGEEDILPFVSLIDRDDRLHIAGIVMPAEDEGKDAVADMIVALCILHQPKEITFICTAWMVASTDGKLPEARPSQHPDRKEIVFVLSTSVDADGEVSMISAPVIRENNLVGLGLWDSPSKGRSSGRFGEALAFGVGAAARIPEDMRAMLKVISDSSTDEREALNRVFGAVVKLRQQAAADAERQAKAARN